MNRALLLLLLSALAQDAAAADWPMYRADAERSGYTADPLPEQLSLHWSYTPLSAPQPAWPRDDRMLFDRAPDVAVAGGLVIFGSTTDCRVIALDAASGAPRWTFFTAAPVRFAPAVWKERVFVVSDDGHMYQLALADGALQRQWRGGPSDEMILGNGRMISRWPARGGPAIRDGVVYFAAGIWQSDGVYLYAIDAETGDVLWCNQEAARIYMAQPHGGAMSESGVTVQGYIVATGDKLLVPTGRAVPAAFQRVDGRFLYYHLQANGRVGGTQTVAARDQFFNSGTLFNTATGELGIKLGVGSLAVTPNVLVHGTASTVKALKQTTKLLPDRKGTPVKTIAYTTAATISDVNGSAAVIVAGNTVVAAGENSVAIAPIDSTRPSWKAEVDGIPHGLAASNGRLYVSTDRGTIYCFASKSSTPPVARGPRRKALAVEEKYARAAEEILQRTQIKEGYCLDLDCGDGQLVQALAERTNLQIYALNNSADAVTKARARLIDSGLYGVRVTVHQQDAADVRYGKYFADLVVSSRSLEAGPLEFPADDPPAVVRPGGEIVCTGRTGAMQLWRRDALAKTGSWTHQYSDLGNTSCSSDEVVKGELHALWFRDVDLDLPQRHGRGPAPLFYQGRMFVEGLHALRAVDAYNGRNLWEFALPGVLTAYDANHLSGTAVTGSNFCVAGDSVFVHDKRACYRLDAATGRKLGEFAAPARADKSAGTWGYIACDGPRLYGSLANAQHRVRYAYTRSDMSELLGESSTLFALAPDTGRLKWRYDAEQSIRHNTIAIGKDRVFLIDRQIANEDRLDPKNTASKLPPVKSVNQPLGKVLALDAETGKVVWSGEQAFGTVLAYSREHDALLMCYQSTRFKLPSEVGGRLAVFRGSTGEQLWEKEATYVTRPLINGPTIYTQNGAWDLVSGEERPFELKRSYGCGQLAGSKNMLLFRSGTLGYMDLTRGSGVENFGGLRPGCWINALPVGGLVLVPDASAGCSCSYQNRSWLALEGDSE